MTDSLLDVLDEHPAAPDELLLADPERSWTHAEVRAAVDACAAELVAAGVGADEPVGLARADGGAFVITMLGIWRAGAVVVPLNARAPERERAGMLATTGTRRWVDDAGLHEEPRTATPMPGVAFVTWTSGTTGAPRPIAHGHREYLELLDRVLVPLRGRAERGERPAPNLVPVSLALNAGIYNTLFGLRAGAAVIVLGRFEPHRFVEAVERHGIRSTVLPPAAIATLTDTDDVTSLGPLRYVRSITAPLTPLTARRFTDRFGVTVLNGYGQAEIGEVIGWTARDAREHPDKVGAVGRPHPGVEIRVDDPDEHGVGRLLVRPPNRAVGEDALAGRVDAGGFVDTGDLARVDADGFVWIEGRTGDVINRGGNKVFPEAVEEVLRLHPSVRDVAVAGRPDARLGEVPVAFVVTDGPLDRAGLEALCREHLVAYKVPVAFEPVDAIPRSEIGKVLRRELAPRAGEA